MNKLSPFLLAFLTSILVSILFFFLVGHFATEINKEKLILASGLMLAATFLLTLILNYSFIYKKLKRLYLTIHNYRKADVQEESQKEIKPGNDVFDDINKEVTVWAEERKAEIDQMKKLETYRKEYLGNVSHELKTPIFNIQGYISTLLDGGLEDETINRDYLKRAENSVERMIGIGWRFLFLGH